MVSIWPHLGHNDSDPYLGLSWTVVSGPYLDIIATWLHSYIPGPHLDLVTVDPPGPHLEELTGSQEGPHLDLLTQVLIWASWDLVSFPHRDLTWS